MMNEIYENFNNFVSELVTYHIKTSPNFTLEKLAEALNLSSSFVQKCVSISGKNHFNLNHIYTISEVMEFPIENFFPSQKNYKLLTNIQLNDTEWYELRKNYFKRGKENLNE